MAFSSYDICSKNLTKSHRHPYGIRSDGERKRWEKLKKNPQHLLCRYCG